MNIIRKLKTAKTVLKQYGIKEAFGLLSDNVQKMLIVAGRIALRLWHNIFDKITEKLPRTSEKMRVLYITSEFEAYHSQTVRYRIHNFRQALQGRASTRFELITEVHLLEWADIVILMRATWTEEVGNIIKKAEKLKIPVVFDIDDIIFLPEFAENYCTVLGDTSKKNISLRRKEFEGFEKTFKSCRFATASTHFIAEKMERAGTRAFIIHNGLNKKQLSIAQNANRKAQNVRAIGYLSGTKTHDRDFKEVLPALEKIFAEYPDVILRLVGYLDTSLIPKPIAQRTQTASYMNWQRLLKYSAQNYINIAPLDVANPFCHAKSELKYFEAAVVGVPTVASATDTFSRCIENGKNGMLAETADEWYAALKKLLDDNSFYNKIVTNAKHHTMENYTPSATAKEALYAYKAIINEYCGR